MKSMFFSIGDRRKRLTVIEQSSDEESTASSSDDSEDPLYEPPRNEINKLNKTVHDTKETVSCSSAGTNIAIVDINDKWYKHRNTLREILIYSNATPIRSSVNYKCCYCKNEFAEPAQLKKHSISHNFKAKVAFAAKAHNYDGRITCVKLDVTCLRCALCPTMDFTLDHLAEHLKLVHKKKIFPDTLNLILPFKFPPDANNFECIKCTSKYITFNALLQHMNEHYQNFFCDICGAGFANEVSISNHSKMHETGRFKCRYCPVIFEFERIRENHEIKLHNTRERTCKICNEVFINRYKKRVHCIKVHKAKTKVTSVPCGACGKQYNCSWRLKKHIRQEHLMERNYKCDLCDKAFLLLSGLKKHMLVHSDAKKFECDDCDKKFKTKYALIVHMRTHTNEKPFKCDVCKQRFTQKIGLKSHKWAKHKIR